MYILHNLPIDSRLVFCDEDSEISASLTLFGLTFLLITAISTNIEQTKYLQLNIYYLILFILIINVLSINGLTKLK